MSDEVEFLSDAWVAALCELSSPPATVDLVIQQHVDDGDRRVSYWLELGSDGIGATSGTTADAGVTFTMTRDIAQALSQGGESALTAFREGGLKMSGDVRRLIEHRNLLAELDDQFGPLRNRTVY